MEAPQGQGGEMSEKYIEIKNHICPFCKSKNIKTTMDEIPRKTYCHTCNAETLTRKWDSLIKEKKRIDAKFFRHTKMAKLKIEIDWEREK